MAQEALQCTASGRYLVDGLHDTSQDGGVRQATYSGMTHEGRAFDLWFNTNGQGGLRFMDFSSINGGNPEIVFDTGPADQPEAEANIVDDDVLLYIRIKPFVDLSEVVYDFRITIREYVRIGESLDP